jgi:arylsulfatase A-like enzyme
MSGPRNLVVVLLDSLCRHLIGPYGGREFDTPNLDRFARRAVRFDNHVTGSLPCMPARHDLLCGAYDFLWKPWGSIEVWEDAVTRPLRLAGVTTMLVTDHPHLFEAGGENYHTDFSAWEYLRGGESDPWRTAPDPSWLGAPALPARRGRGGGFPYDTNRTWFGAEEDFPGPKTMCAAAEWLEANYGRHDRFLLVLDEFDPHEPFDVPEPWASRYDTTWAEDERLIWPPYTTGAIATGKLSPEEARHLRANYGAKLSMIDHWFGRVLDSLDRAGAWADTAVVVTTDHGLYLGERDIWGKPRVMQYRPLGHIPLLVAWPGAAPGVRDALTTTVDVFATITDLFGVGVEQQTHGRSLIPLLEATATTIRDWALGGVWGNWVQVTTARHSYARAPVGDNVPLAMWSNRWSTMPVHQLPGLRLPRPDGRAALAHMPGSDIPVIRQPFAPGDLLPFWAFGDDLAGRHHLYDRIEDPDEVRDLTGTAVETELIEVLRGALAAVAAPDEQLQRLGLT